MPQFGLSVVSTRNWIAKMNALSPHSTLGLMFLTWALFPLNATADLALIQQPLTWAEAEQYAQTEFNGHLVTISDETENQAVLTLMQAQGVTAAWIGFNDRTIEGQWQWASDSSAYSNWVPGNPDNWTGHNDNGEDAALMLSDGRWQDQSELYTRPFVVEFEPEAQVNYRFFSDLDPATQSVSSLALEFRNADQSGVSPGVTLAARPPGQNSHFALMFSGEIYLNGGEVSFTLRSDDGANLWLGNEIILFNDGRHAAREISVSVSVEPGWHPFRVDYHEAGGDEILELWVQQEDAAEPIPFNEQALRRGVDRDQDYLTDSYDVLYGSGCSMAAVADPNITDHRGCDFSYVTFPGGSLRGKYFDQATFDTTHLNGTWFWHSSFRGATFRNLYEQNGSGGVDYYQNGDPDPSYFLDADFTGATLEAHWPFVNFYGVQWGDAYFNTSDSNNGQGEWLCFANSRFSSLDWLTYRAPLADQQSGQQDYFGIPGIGYVDTSNYWGHSCIDDIGVDDWALTEFMPDELFDIAPAIYTRENIKSELVHGHHSSITTHENPEPQYHGIEVTYPVNGNDLQHPYRSEGSAVSPWWQWEMGNYFHVDRIRIYKNPAKPNELDDAVLITSEWQIDDESIHPINFDSIARFHLGRNTKPYIDVPINRSVRFIRIQRPINGRNQYLSFKKLEIFGNAEPLLGAQTPQPANYELPMSDPSGNCHVMHNANAVERDHRDPNVPADQWGSRQLTNFNFSYLPFSGYDFSRDYLENVDFQQTDLQGANLKGAWADGANFRGANLAGADLTGASIQGADFRGANLQGAIFGDVRAECAFFSGELPVTFSKADEFDGDPVVSTISSNDGFGYARASSQDYGTSPRLAIDNQTHTVSISAVESQPWWELDMGAVYMLNRVSVLTDHPDVEAEQLTLLISDWPINASIESGSLPSNVTQVENFSVQDGLLEFATHQTGRFLRIQADVDLGQVRLRLAEVDTLTPAVATRPATAMELTESQKQNLVPNTQALLTKLVDVKNLYQSETGGGDLASTLSSLYLFTFETMSASENFTVMYRNFRRATRPIGTIDFFSKRLRNAPYIGALANGVYQVVHPIELFFKFVNANSFLLQQEVALQVATIQQSQVPLLAAMGEVSQQVDELEKGALFIQHYQQCAIYGSQSEAVRTALESYSAQALVRMQTLQNLLINEQQLPQQVAHRLSEVQEFYQFYTTSEIVALRAASEEVLTALGPTAAALTPMQLLLAGGEIYEGFTLLDLVEVVAEFSGVASYIPGVQAMFDELTGLLDPVFEDLLVELALDSVTDLMASDDSGNLHEKLASIYEELLEVNQGHDFDGNYTVANVPADLFDALVNVTGDSIFSSCLTSLNLPPQWPTPHNDNDGDGLLNAFEAGYKLGEPGEILPTTETLVDNPDSDLDGLSDYFEWYWSTQTEIAEWQFDPTFAQPGEPQRDDDNDGLPALLEQALGTNPYSADTDNDGLGDQLEFAWGTDPKVANDLQVDLDDDGIPLAYEVQYGLSAIDPKDAFEDQDEDGISTHQEYLAGTDPRTTAFTISEAVRVFSISSSQELAQEFQFDLAQWIDYPNLDEVSINEESSFASEGEWVVDEENTLLVTFAPEVDSIATRQIALIFKVNSPGGSHILDIILNVDIPDFDQDGIEDSLDSDIDNDGWANNLEEACGTESYDAESIPTDTDEDSLCNALDLDDDNDQVPDEEDAFPLDPTEHQDSDLDGIGDNADPTPYPVPAVITFTATEIVSETDSEVQLLLTRSENFTSKVAIQWVSEDGTATGSEDYTPGNGLLEFEHGQEFATLSVPLIDDDIFEGDEFFSLRFTGVIADQYFPVSITTRPMRVTIEDNDPAPEMGVVEFELGSVSVPEDGESLGISILRHSGLDGAVSVHVNSHNGTAESAMDYQAVSDIIDFAEGENQKSIELVLIDDEVFEGNEQLTLSLSNPVGGVTLGTRQQLEVTVEENDPIPPSGVVSLSAVSIAHSENAAELQFSLIRSEGSFGEITVNLQSVDGSAQAGEDFEALNREITFAPEQTSISVIVTIIDDQVFEDTETFTVELASDEMEVLGDVREAEITILDDDTLVPTGLVQFSGTQYQTEESAEEFRVTLLRGPTAEGELTIILVKEAPNGQVLEEELQFADGITELVYQIEWQDDSEYLEDRIWQLQLRNVGTNNYLGQTQTATLTVKEDDPKPNGGTFQFSATEIDVPLDQQQVSFTIVRSGGSDGEFPVQIVVGEQSTLANDQYQIDADWIFADGQTTQSVTLDLTDYKPTESTQTLVLMLTGVEPVPEPLVVTLAAKPKSEGPPQRATVDLSGTSLILVALLLLILVSVRRPRSK